MIENAGKAIDQSDHSSKPDYYYYHYYYYSEFHVAGFKLLYQFSIRFCQFNLIDGSRMVWRHVVIALALFVAGSYAGEADVLDLTDDDFYTRVAETETTLVMFYAPW